VQNPENPSCPSGKSLRVSADAVVVRGWSWLIGAQNPGTVFWTSTQETHSLTLA
jgi:hypothetical protein